MRLSVIIPTYRRAGELYRCLEKVLAQKRRADEIIVVTRLEDREARSIIVSPIREVNAAGDGGVVAAMNAGLNATEADIIALTDDDAQPHGDWLERIEAAFTANPSLGAFGGKDLLHYGNPPIYEKDIGTECRAGEIQWFGRIVGDHHRATLGPPREVAVLKGVNCAFRATALRDCGGFDNRLRGTGAQVHWELGVCLSLARAGWKVVFDPSLLVDHFPAARFDEDQRGTFNAVAQRNMVHNETLLLCEHFRGVRRVIYLIWALTIGTRTAPGPLQVLRLLPHERSTVMSRWWNTIRGRISGFANAKFK